MTSKLTHKRILAMILVIIIGFSGGIFIKTMLRVGEGEDVDITAIRQANEALLEEKERYDALQAQNADLEDRKRILLRRFEDYEDTGGILAELRENAWLSGMTDVEGKGIVLTLDDKLDYDPLVDPIESVIHDSTVNYVVNLLWSGGARAVSFNGVRLTSVSEISCVGPVILCYGIRQMPPYVLEAIGPVDAMRDVLEKDSYLAHLTQSKIGIRFSVNTEEQMLLPSFSRTHDILPYINLLREP
jgi:uncharacterized protein YlxW (UPF0749 family)